MTTDSVLARLAEIPGMDITALKDMWRELFQAEPPPYNRKFLESRLAYRVQELAYGGLKPETVRRLAALGDALQGKGRGRGRGPSKGAHGRPAVGTRLIREWRGVEHCVTVLADGFEYEGRPYKSLSSVARAITGTRWNGPLFFGLRSHRGTGS